MSIHIPIHMLAEAVFADVAALFSYKVVFVLGGPGKRGRGGEGRRKRGIDRALLP
jgi:hypothetical protein